MASIKAKFSVGLFVIIGFSLVIVTVIWLGMSNYLEEGKLYVAFFDESVQGLDKDSPVKYRGVSIGRVQRIGVSADANLIQVDLKIEAPMELQDDIIAQLKSVGITGIMYVELERKAEDEPNLTPAIDFPTKYPVIATRPSGIKQLLDAIYIAINQFNKMDIQGVTTQLKATLDKMAQAVTDAQIEVLSEKLQETLTRAQVILDPQKWDPIMSALETSGRTLPRLAEGADRTLQKAETILAANGDTLQEALRSFNDASEQADLFFTEGREFLQGETVDLEKLHTRLVEILDNLEMASINLNRLMDVVSAHPAQLLLGDPPSEKIPGETSR